MTREYFMGEQTGQEWLDRRNSAHLNSSNTGILFGDGYVSRYTYFKEKIGKIKPRDLSNNEYIKHGNEHELTALNWYKALKEPGNKDIRTDHQICLYRGIAGSPDAVSSTTMYEIKCPTYEWEADKPLPIKYLLQLAMNMYLYEKKRGILIIYFLPMYIEFNEPEYHDILAFEITFDMKWFHSFIMPVVHEWVQLVKKKQLSKIPKKFSSKEKQKNFKNIRQNIVIHKIL